MKLNINQKDLQQSDLQEVQDWPELNQFAHKLPNVDELLRFCTEQKCSDLFLKVGEQPYICRFGKMYRVPCYNLNMPVWNDFAQQAISSENNAIYVRQKMLDFSYQILVEKQDGALDQYRYRVSAGFSGEANIATFRMISVELPTFDSIHMPNMMRELLRKALGTRGNITLLCGVTGSGKTTTLAACFQEFTQPGQPFENAHIITLEDPVEYLYPGGPRTRVVQKELGKDFQSFNSGIKQALREHPTHIEVGEARDAETIRTLIEASRTGHSVLSTFHTGSVADTVSRLYSYLASENGEIIYDLISNMNIVICQRLKPDQNGYKLETQYMYFTPAIIKLLTEAIQAGKNIPAVINKLFENQQLVQSGILKDWS